MARTQGVLPDLGPACACACGSSPPQGTGLQRNGRQRRAQLVGHFIGQPPLAHQCVLLAVQQGVDGGHHRFEFAPGMARRQTLVWRGPARPHRQTGRTRAASPAARPAPGPAPPRAAATARARSSARQCPGQLVPLAHSSSTMILRVLGASHCEKLRQATAGAQVQIGKPFGSSKAGRGACPLAQPRGPRIPLHHADGLLVVVRFEPGRGRLRGGGTPPQLGKPAA
jgi:hypothetical protein